MDPQMIPVLAARVAIERLDTKIARGMRRRHRRPGAFARVTRLCAASVTRAIATLYEQAARQSTLHRPRLRGQDGRARDRSRAG